MNKERRTGSWRRQTEHIHGHLWFLNG